MLWAFLLPAAAYGQCSVQFNQHCSDCAHMYGDKYENSAGFGLPHGISGFKIEGPDDCVLKAYDDLDFTGESKEFTPGDVCNFCAAGWNDNIKSFKIKGSGCTVQFNEHCSDCAHMVGDTYSESQASGLPAGISGFKIDGEDCELHVFAEEDYGGRSDSFTESVCNICSLPHWNDRMRSFQIGQKGKWQEGETRPKISDDQCVVTFNEHCSDCWHLYGDRHTEAVSTDLIDGISGFKLEGPADCELTIFDEEEQKGRSETFTESVCNFCAYSWNDKVNSFNLEGEGCKVQFNEHCTDCQHMFGPTFSEPKADGLPAGISGWKLEGEKCKLTIYEEEGWKGRNAEFTESVCNLCAHVNWNDKAHSFTLKRTGGDSGGSDTGGSTGSKGSGCSDGNGDNKACKKIDGCRYNKKEAICEPKDDSGDSGSGGSTGGGGTDQCTGVKQADPKSCKKANSGDCAENPACMMKKGKCKPVKKVKCKKLPSVQCCMFPGCYPDGKKCGGDFSGWK